MPEHVEQFIQTQIPLTWLLSTLGAIIAAAFIVGGIYSSKSTENTTALLRMENAVQNATVQMTDVKAVLARQSTINERITSQLAKLESADAVHDQRLRVIESDHGRIFTSPRPRKD